MNGIDINFANALCEPFTQNISIYLAIKGSNQIAVADSLTFRSYEEGMALAPLSPIKLTRPAAQILMDALWRCDVRPSSSIDQKVETRALEAHLQEK